MQCKLIKLTKSLQSQVKNEKMTKSLQSQGKSLQSQVVKNLDPLTSKLAGNNSVKLTKQIHRFIVQSISISISTIYGTECNENIGSIILKIRYFITDN